MRKYGRRILSLFLVLIMCVSMLQTTVFAENVEDTVVMTDEAALETTDIEEPSEEILSDGCSFYV